MAKKLVIAAVVILAGLAGYNMITTGKLTLIPSTNASPEEQRLTALESRVQAAGREISQAGQMAGLGGLDSTAQVERALRDLEDVEKALQDLKKKAGSATVRDKCDRLVGQVRSMRGAR